MHQKLLSLAVLVALPIVAIADESIQKDHATVNVVFVVPYELSTMGGGMGGIRAGVDEKLAQKPEPLALVGDMAIPIASVHPISIRIDGEFVGHSMPGLGVKPVFVLPHGKHKFEFSSEAFETTTLEMTAIGSGSKQYLIVKLIPIGKDASQVKPVGDANDAATTPKR